MSEAAACRAILILTAYGDRTPMRQVKLLAALGSIKPNSGGVIEVGRELLLEKTGLSLNTLNLARVELVKAGLVTYEPGQGRGKQSRWTINAPIKGGRDGAADLRKQNHLAGVKGGRADPEKGVGRAIKGGRVTPSDLGKPDTGHKDSGHKDSGQSLSVETRVIQLAKKHLGADITAGQAADLIEQLEPTGGYRHGPVPFITRCLIDTPDNCRAIIAGDFVPGGRREVAPFESGTEWATYTGY